MTRKFVYSAMGFSIFAFGLTLLYLGMRAVMDVGGACASGGPYVSAQECPAGTGYMMLGFFACGVGAVLILVGAIPKGPRLLIFTWASIFLSLGWNFIDYGFSSESGGGGRVGLLVCAGLFVLMGGAPLLFAISDPKKTFWGNDKEVDYSKVFSGESNFRSRLSAREFVVGDQSVASRGQGRGSHPTDASTDSESSDDLVESLRRLSEMWRNGDLSDDEYARAKNKILEGGPE